jgi:hypothetical protein
VSLTGFVPQIETTLCLRMPGGSATSAGSILS